MFPVVIVWPLPITLLGTIFLVGLNRRKSYVLDATLI